EVVWEKEISSPLMAQRLPNGNTFIANYTQLLEVDRAGKVVSTQAPPDGDTIMRARKLANGNIACVTATRKFMEMDANGKEVRSFHVDVQTSGGRIEVLPNGHVLSPHMNQNKVVEYDTNGKEVWEVSVEQPIVATRLPNGNTIVTSMTQNRAVEFDRNGKE